MTGTCVAQALVVTLGAFIVAAFFFWAWNGILDVTLGPLVTRYGAKRVAIVAVVLVFFVCALYIARGACR